MTLPHGPLVHTPLDMNASTKLEKHKAMVEYIDFLTGKLVNHLDENLLASEQLSFYFR